MKTRVLTYLVFTFCFGQVFSQELRMMPRDFDAENSEKQNNLTLITFGSDLYNLKLANYNIGAVSLGINSRLEEELPYENTSYDYTGFYYLDVGVSYVIDSFSLVLSIDNFLNLDNKNFSIDPIVEKSNGIISDYYFSHETDALILMTITYNF